MVLVLYPSVSETGAINSPPEPCIVYKLWPGASAHQAKVLANIIQFGESHEVCPNILRNLSRWVSQRLTRNSVVYPEN